MIIGYDNNKLLLKSAEIKIVGFCLFKILFDLSLVGEEH